MADRSFILPTRNCLKARMEKIVVCQRQDGEIANNYWGDRMKVKIKTLFDNKYSLWSNC